MISTTTILVGCGGSGLKTLTRVNELLAKDNYWRYRIAKDIYYLVVDTEEAELLRFRAAIRSQLHGAHMPVIRSLQLSQGATILQPLVTEHFIRPYHDADAVMLEGRKRLYEHWWMRNGNEPFDAQLVKPLRDGAGQCPPVSYFLTWWKMKEIEKIFEDFVKEIIAHKKGVGEAALERLNFLIVSGLSGGTGRGSWQLIAFKLREMFSQYRRVAFPVAYLFDASVHRNVMDDKPRLETQMKVNSLTGISELRCWMKNLESVRSETYRYQLPDMAGPEDEAVDVLKIDLEMDASNAAPVDNAYLIFDRSDVAVLHDNEQYHEMVGSAIYASLSRSAIRAERINQHEPYWSVAAATFEVDANTLLKFFEGLVRIKAIHLLQAADDALVNKLVKEFIKRTRLELRFGPAVLDTEEGASRLGGTGEDSESPEAVALSADVEGSLLQLACEELRKEFDNDLAGFSDALEQEHPEVIDEILSGLLKPSKAAVGRTVSHMMRSLEHKPVEVAKRTIAAILKDTNSIENVRRFVAEVMREMDRQVAAMPDPDNMRLEEEERPETLVKDFRRRQYLVFGPYYDEGEREAILQQTETALLYANYGYLCEEFKDQIREWKGELAQCLANAEAILTRSKKLISWFREEMHKEAGLPDDEYFAPGRLFTDAERPEDGIPHQFSYERFYRRELRPVLDRNAGPESLLDEIKLSGPLLDLLRRGLLELKLDDHEAEQRYRRDLEQTLRETIRLPWGFVEERFTITKVIDDLRRAWGNRLREESGNQDRHMRLREKFEYFFGVTPIRDGGDWVLPERGELLIGMASSLAASCKPFWQLRDPADAQHRVLLFLPTWPGADFDQQKTEDMIMERLQDVEVDVISDMRLPDEDDNRQSNAFLMLAYASAGVSTLDQIASLDYWKDANVVDWLERTEDPSGDSIFDTRKTNGGLGYTDPLYVRDERVSSKRWKPWATTDSRTLDAILYGLMELPEAVKELFAARDWTTPLIIEKANERFTFARPGLKWTGTKAEITSEASWEPDQQIEQSIRNVFAVIEGTSDNGNGLAWRSDILAEQEHFERAAARLGFNAESEGFYVMLGNLANQLKAKRGRDKSDPDYKVWDTLLRHLQQKMKSLA